MSEPAPVKRRRHLMDPANPRRSSPGGMSLTQVQKWVMSTLAVTTILHLVVGLVVAAAVVDEDRLDAQVGLLIIAGAFGVLSVAAARAIHQKPLLTPWLALGAVPALVGIPFVF
ncbi:hypothetical protein EKO23_12070 [Nocardioides guangzhouensis]|uniref:Uncharacterized protein n=1 Tax=Nocardioides guangzhouensis TaxID=2497878 RepID=A0A4Q4ZE71_9ACTN|nr:hypothetical protein [Nocardioides guangzhouensis]RYP85494.1 hypothetical protein EKO23_12070 [Nocardioides guangzhouensis]